MAGAFAGFLLVIILCAVATALAAWLVRRYSPDAAGSGIPSVESFLEGEPPPAPYRLIPVKFFGGLLSIGAGLALGREGPGVQMGASVTHCLARLFHRNEKDCRVVLTAGAGAGLATSFNAPIAGAVFVLEELVRRFDTRIAIVTFGASTGANCRGTFVSGQYAGLPCPSSALSKLWHRACAFSPRRPCWISGSRLQPCASRNPCRRGQTSSLAAGT